MKDKTIVIDHWLSAARVEEKSLQDVQENFWGYEHVL